MRSGAAVEALAAATMARFGTVHLLFNNAGVGAGGRIWENTSADWEWVLGVNLWGVIHGCAYSRHFAGPGRARSQLSRPHRQYLVGGRSALGTGPGVYNVSKHAVVALSETLLHDLAGVRAPIGVSVLCPGFVPTGISSSSRNRPSELRNERPPTESEKRVAASVSHAVERPAPVRPTSPRRLSMRSAAAASTSLRTELLPAVHSRCDDLRDLRNPTLVRLKSGKPTE